MWTIAPGHSGAEEIMFSLVHQKIYWKCIVFLMLVVQSSKLGRHFGKSSLLPLVHYCTAAPSFLAASKLAHLAYTALCLLPTTSSSLLLTPPFSPRLHQDPRYSCIQDEFKLMVKPNFCDSLLKVLIKSFIPSIQNHANLNIHNLLEMFICC